MVDDLTEAFVNMQSHGGPNGRPSI
jgi:hypothetical protein